MTSSSRASVTQSESLERSGVPALKDTLALFEQSLANQEHWSQQLAEDHAASVKAVAKKAATHAAELQKILTGKDAAPVVQTDFKLHGKDSTKSDQSRNDKVGEVHYGHSHGFTDHQKSDGSSKALFYEDRGCLDRSRSRSIDRKLGRHHRRARSRSPAEIDPYYCSDRRRRSRSRSRDNNSKHRWIGARSRRPNDMECLDRTRNKNMDRRLGGHHRGARSRSPNEIDHYYCSKRSRSRSRSRSMDNTSKHRWIGARSRSPNDMGCLDRTRNKNMDGRLGGHQRRTRSRSPNEIDAYCCSDRRRSRSRGRDNTSKHRWSDRSRSRERNGSHCHGDRNRYADKRSLHNDSDRATGRDRSSDCRIRDRVSRREKI